ncbi:hypothetical protein J2799_001275 [Chryseobacterium vietnamense]|uniref:hypothetical protein n=1 Tax=Chryseobacterium vietnamense TaxID=866785 RepID=UPI0028676730|nr:hypothetical protein [Chryseobacterium vietnamense]MDR6486790.1 hypothetical protein [Chryseobacterium vietnamense]
MKVIGISKLRSRFFLMLALGSIFFSCKNSDDDDSAPNSHGIEVATGVFKGTMKIQGQDYYNAIVNVSKTDDAHVKVQPKSGEAYSVATSKTINVTNTAGISVSGNDSQGSVNYMISSKSLQISTQKTSENDVAFYFEGEKQ